MKFLIITLIVLGSLKLVSLFIMLIIELYHAITKKDINGIQKTYGIYKDTQFYLIPTIGFIKSSKHLEISCHWLWFVYYNCYRIDDEEQ